jgi:hypothetical protein
MLVRFKAIHRNTNFPLHVLNGPPVNVTLAKREVNRKVHTVGFGKYAPEQVLRVTHEDGPAVMDFLVSRYGNYWRFEVVDDASGKTYGELLEDAEAASLDAEDQQS